MSEHIFDKVVGEVVWLIMIAIGGTMFVISRITISKIKKAQASSVINRIKRDPSYAHEFARQLDIPYATKQNFHADNFKTLKQYLSTQASVGNYRLLHLSHVAPFELLIFTELIFTDVDINMIGTMSNAKKRESIAFLLRYEQEKQCLEVRSDIYHNPDEKFQRSEFLNSIFEGRAY